jgi:hypothetical protein
MLKKFRSASLIGLTVTGIVLFDTIVEKALATVCWVGLYPGSTVNPGYDRICENVNPFGEFMGETDCDRLITQKHGPQYDFSHGGKQWEIFFNDSDSNNSNPACQHWINDCKKCDPNNKPSMENPQTMS